MTDFFENVYIIAQIAVEDLNTLDDKGFAIVMQGLTHTDPIVRLALMQYWKHAEIFDFRQKLNRIHHQALMQVMAKTFMMDERREVRLPILEMAYWYGTKHSGNYNYLHEPVRAVLNTDDAPLRIAALKAIGACHITALNDDLLHILNTETDLTIRAYTAIILNLRLEDNHPILDHLADGIELFKLGIQSPERYWQVRAGKFLKRLHGDVHGIGLMDLIENDFKDHALKRDIERWLDRHRHLTQANSAFAQRYDRYYSPNGKVFRLAGLDLDPDDNESWEVLTDAIREGQAAFFPIANLLYGQGRKQKMEAIYEQTVHTAQDNIRKRIEQGYQRQRALIERMDKT